MAGMLLENEDHAQFDVFMRRVLEDHKNGDITTDQAVGGMNHVFAALDNGNIGEVRVWLAQGRKLMRQSR